MRTPILPGATIGIFGSGQLGRMIALAAKSIGYRIYTYSPDTGSPTGQVADREFSASYEDFDSVAAFVRSVDIVTFEFENVDARVADVADSEGVPVHPGEWVLRTAQNRITEKAALRSADLPVTPYRPIHTLDDLRAAGVALGYPLVLKTASSGYDGKGQIVVGNEDDMQTGWLQIGEQVAVAEQLVPFEREVSVVATRGWRGEFSHFGVVENLHRNHILDISISPARIPQETASRAVGLARATMDELNVVGTLCIEFFMCVDGTLLINEIAPRPHNSGHLTIEAFYTSQFEQHVRAICGLPLGDTSQHAPAAMANLLGDLWADGSPDWSSVLAHSGVKLHLYGKSVARPGRKMGHLTALGPDVEAAAETVLAARRALVGPEVTIDKSIGVGQA